MSGHYPIHSYIIFYCRPSINSKMAPTKTSRSRLRSSATEPYSLDQCNKIINSHFKRTKHQSAPGGGEGRSTPAGDQMDPRRSSSDSNRTASENASGNSSDSRCGDDAEDIPLEIPLEVGTTGRESNINRLALIVRDQLLSTNNVMRIIGENSALIPH